MNQEIEQQESTHDTILNNKQYSPFIEKFKLFSFEENGSSTKDNGRLQDSHSLSRSFSPKKKLVHHFDEISSSLSLSSKNSNRKSNEKTGSNVQTKIKAFKRTCSVSPVSYNQNSRVVTNSRVSQHILSSTACMNVLFIIRPPYANTLVKVPSTSINDDSNHDFVETKYSNDNKNDPTKMCTNISIYPPINSNVAKVVR